MSQITVQPGLENRRWEDQGWADRGGSAVLGGLVAGVIAGIAMGMVSMLHAEATGEGFFLPLKLIAAAVYGVDALIGDAGVIVAGMAIHMMNSMIFGLIFSLLVGRRTSGIAALVWGLIYGAAIWALMTFIALPMADPTMRERVPLMPFSWFISHLVFGGMLFLTPLLSRAFTHAGRRSLAA
jgi:uncharacterized membrane protein YagU involved in acid resistance